MEQADRGVCERHGVKKNMSINADEIRKKYNFAKMELSGIGHYSIDEASESLEDIPLLLEYITELEKDITYLLEKIMCCGRCRQFCLENSDGFGLCYYFDETMHCSDCEHGCIAFQWIGRDNEVDLI